MKKLVLAITALLWALVISGCSAGETQLIPETREGIFYNDFAEAQSVAMATDKYLLLDMWRPG